VESDPVERKRLAAALERDGFEVLLCSGRLHVRRGAEWLVRPAAADLRLCKNSRTCTRRQCVDAVAHAPERAGPQASLGDFPMDVRR
jgi:hypothetical protein